MCVVVYYKDHEISSPKELSEILEIPIEKLAISKEFILNVNACLCQVDIRKTLRDNNFKFELSEDTWDYTIIL